MPQNADGTGQSLLIYGNPIDGLTMIGPVTPNDPELDSFIDKELHGTEWWLTPLRSLADAIKGASSGN